MTVPLLGPTYLLVGLIAVQVPGRFHLADFLRPKNRERSGVFFDVLFNLGEFLSFEGPLVLLSAWRIDWCRAVFLELGVKVGQRVLVVSVVSGERRRERERDVIVVAVVTCLMSALLPCLYNRS